MIGKLEDPVLLAAVGMGNCFQNLVGTSVIFGLNGALETLAS